jgi:hypothetical protein
MLRRLLSVLEEQMNKPFFLMFAAIVLPAITGTTVLGQEAAPRPTPASDAPAVSDQDLDLFRKDVRSVKKQIVALNMDLTDNEAVKFWPVYDKYTAELTSLYDRKYELLQRYAANYGTLTSEQADNYVTGRAEVEEAIMKLRMKYYPLFRQVLSGTSAALFVQMDWRLGLIMELQLVSQTPLIQP